MLFVDASDDAAQVLDGLRRIVRELRITSHAVEREHGISGAQLFVLRELAAEPRCSIRRLSERTLTDPSSVSVVVARLTRRGLVGRRRAAGDARRQEVSLTKRGQSVLTQASEPFQLRLVRVLKSMPKARLRRLSADLSAVVRAVGADSGAAPMFFDDEPRRKTRRDR
jgi:DNA-binding MarR family transcriptional regulator